MIERDLEVDLKKWLFEGEIIAIRGPRQCGKTTLLEKIKVMLAEKGVNEGKIRRNSTSAYYCNGSAGWEGITA